MKIVRINGVKYIAQQIDTKKTIVNDSCLRCAFNCYNGYIADINCVKTVGDYGYFIKDTFINRIKVLLKSILAWRC